MDAQRGRGEASGRLDVLGGVAADAGALVLAMPTRATTRVEISGRAGAGLSAFSCQSESNRAAFSVQSTTLRALLSLPASQWRDKLESLNASSWMLHVWGSFGIFVRSTGWWPTGGLHFRVASDILWSRGVASSSALCLATLRALEQYAGIDFTADEKAAWALEVEQSVMGLPCELSTPVACAMGTHGELIPVLCRPGCTRDNIPLPKGVVVVGCPQGTVAQTHAPGRVARVAARMGNVLLREKLGSRDYLSEYAPSQLGTSLPVAVRGSDFLARGNGSFSENIEESVTYPVRAATLFASEENFRAQLAQSLLKCGASGCLPLVGELMYQSHTALGSVGLTTPASNALVEALRARGAAKGIYGARVTGEGVARTVVVLLKESARGDLEKIREKFSPAGALIE